MKRLDLAQYAARLAKNSAEWSGDLIDLVEDADDQLLPETVKLYLQRMREILAVIERRAGLAGPATHRKGASEEPLAIIEANECGTHEWSNSASLVTQRFKRVFNVLHEHGLVN